MRVETQVPEIITIVQLQVPSTPCLVSVFLLSFAFQITIVGMGLPLVLMILRFVSCNTVQFWLELLALARCQ